MESKGIEIELKLGVDSHEPGADAPLPDWLTERARTRMSLARALLAEDDWYCNQVRDLLADADNLREAAGAARAGESVTFAPLPDPEYAEATRARIAVRAYALARTERSACALSDSELSEFDWLVLSDPEHHPEGEASA